MLHAEVFDPQTREKAAVVDGIVLCAYRLAVLRHCHTVWASEQWVTRTRDMGSDVLGLGLAGSERFMFSCELT